MEALFPGLSESRIGYLLKLAHGESLRTAKKLYNVAAEFAAAQGSALTVKHLRAIGSFWGRSAHERLHNSGQDK